MALDTEAARRVPSTANQSSRGIFQRSDPVGDTSGWLPPLLQVGPGSAECLSALLRGATLGLGRALSFAEFWSPICDRGEALGSQDLFKKSLDHRRGGHVDLGNPSSF